MKSRSGHDNILGTEANSGENTRAYNRRSGSHFANGADNNATQVKECGLCRTEFSMFKWRNVCSQCRRVVCSDCLTKKQIDQLFLMGLQAEREAKARGLDLNAEDITVDPEQQEDAADPQDLTRPGLPQSASDSAVETGTRSDLTGVLPQRSQSFNINDSNSNNNSGSGYGGFGNGWRGIKGNTDSGHGQAEKLCDPCYLGLTDDQIKVLESGGGWQYYQATLSKHQTPGLAAALALSNMSLEDVVENGKAGSEKGAKLVPDAMRVEGSLVRAG
ncbi:hypothetical protein BC939DRAFT_454485 [Gamsiella multidivaricata]|uniref:uncharacterized protein n=1 Tax=Gamsiella multidivaricata TaxID=101098 RepID=UPI0022208784|nr:uncharacterized protein BC939DRAFT_454485 [Gamsiella multidivaricata]KAI7822009.1 hypothetical protein BC939DRAFT_454485 [Gamsiella multidivaricata]